MFRAILATMLSVQVLLLACLLQKSCPNCLHRGVLPCQGHGDVGVEEEQPSETNPLLYCSVAAECSACGGALWVDCPRCTSGERSSAVAERRALIASWRAPNALERELGRPVTRLETKRYDLVVDVRELAEGTKRTSGHVLLHRLARDGEHVSTLVTGHYAMTDQDYRAKMRMWLWDSLATHQKAQEKFLGTLTTGDFKMLGRDPVFSVWDEPGLFDTVPDVRALFAHNAAHMLLSNAYEPNWVGDIGGGWLDAGLGHWYEYELFGRTLNYCLEEATLNDGYENGQWRAPVRRRLEREKDPFLPGLLPKRTGAMTPAEHALCWSFYDYLLHEQRAALRPILLDLKHKKPARAVLAQHLGMDLFAIEEAWRAWVAACYPMKGDDQRPAPDSKKGKKK